MFSLQALFCQGILSEASRLHKMNKLTIASPGKLRSKQIWAQLAFKTKNQSMLWYLVNKVLIICVNSILCISIREHLLKKNVFFRALPELPFPSSPHHISGNLYLFFRTPKTTFCAYDRKKPITVQ